jgi:dynein heavy chain
MWLIGLHGPEAYLTALLQTFYHSKGWPLDKATLALNASSNRNFKKLFKNHKLVAI